MAKSNDPFATDRLASEPEREIASYLTRQFPLPWEIDVRVEGDGEVIIRAWHHTFGDRSRKWFVVSHMDMGLTDVCAVLERELRRVFATRDAAKADRRNRYPPRGVT